jgi:cytoskeletal protein RodZ
MESIGEMLREARHNKKASLEDASRATKIKVEILEKLESDEFDRLAAPMYTKGFLKLYAEYLGMDSQSVVEMYIRSQGGLRRTGLSIETEASARARRRTELKLPLRSVAMVVGALTVAVIGIFGVRAAWSHWKQRPVETAAATATTPATPTSQQPATLPKADFEAFYQPATKASPELLEAPPTK